MSILETSPRKEFEEIIIDTEALFKEIAGLGDDYRLILPGHRSADCHGPAELFTVG